MTESASPSPTRIAILDDYQGVALNVADWTSLPPDTALMVFRDVPEDESALIERLKPFHILVAMRERTSFPASILEHLPNLRLIAATGKRQSNIDLEAATRLGILVATTDSPGHSTTELTWALIFAITRRVPQEDAAMRAGRWQTTLGVGLQGKALGLVGLGRVGSDVARIAPAFDMDILVWSPTMTQKRAGKYGAEAVSKADLFSQSDIVSIHVPLNDGSHGLVDESDLALMHPTSYLINTSRGPIVNEDALIRVLKEGRIAGAALDVYDQEPLPAGHPLTALDNVVLTPHLGYVTDENYHVFYGQSVDNVRAYLSGEPTNVLNPDALGKRLPPTPMP